MLKGSILIFLLMIVGEFLGFALIIAATRLLSLETAGLLIYLQNNLFLFGAVGTLGLGTAMYRFIPRYRETGQFATVHALIRWSRSWALLASVLSTGLFVATQYISPEIILKPWHMALFGMCILAWSYLTMDRQILRALGVVFWSDFSYQIIRPSCAVLTLLVGVLVLPQDTAVFAALLIPLLLGLIYDCWQLRRTLGPRPKDTGTDPVDRAAWWQSSRHFTLVMMARVLRDRLDVLMVGALLGFEAAAIYGIVARVSILAAMVVEPIQSMFQPRASLHFARHDESGLQRDIVQSVYWSATAALVVCAVLFGAPAFWLQLFGEAFDPQLSILLLIIMIVGRVPTAISSTANSLLLMSGHEKLVSRLMTSINFVLLPISLYFGTTLAGMLGAALAVSGVRILTSGLVIYFAWAVPGYLILSVPTPERLRVAFKPFYNALSRLWKN
ncbi:MULTISPECIES: lipopolysaccharide biosynthesis protein [Roseobacteraceae]|uniref:lipopolysaccharide biosynthesis protein n=1 Tax=Roseobacteraceae TaxID=2854170 RepID=UPI0040593227